MVSVLKKAGTGRNKPDGVVINNRYKWIEFEALNESDEPYVIRCRVRTSLLYSEVEALIKAEQEEGTEGLWEVVHPYVKEWNILYVDDEGDLCQVLPPSEGGAQSFAFAPRLLVHAIINSLMVEPFRRVDPKSSTPVESTDEP